MLPVRRFRVTLFVSSFSSRRPPPALRLGMEPSLWGRVEADLEETEAVYGEVVGLGEA